MSECFFGYHFSRVVLEKGPLNRLLFRTSVLILNQLSSLKVTASLYCIGASVLRKILYLFV